MTPIEIEEEFSQCTNCGAFLVGFDDCPYCSEDERRDESKRPKGMVKLDSKRRKPKYINTARKKRTKEEPSWNQ